MYEYQAILLKAWVLHWGSLCGELKIILEFQILQDNAMVKTKKPEECIFNNVNYCLFPGRMHSQLQKSLSRRPDQAEYKGPMPISSETCFAVSESWFLGKDLWLLWNC